jgi:hypothetical protein
LLPQSGGDTMRWFEQAISKNKVSSNAISPPCEAKAQTVVVPVISGAVCRRVFPTPWFDFGVGFLLPYI